MADISDMMRDLWKVSCGSVEECLGDKDGKEVEERCRAGKKVVEAAREEELLHVRRLGLHRVLPIGDDPYGNVMDDRIR